MPPFENKLQSVFVYCLKEIKACTWPNNFIANVSARVEQIEMCECFNTLPADRSLVHINIRTLYWK